jgi:hypothetical protein
MGYLIKSDVIDTLREDMETTMMCYKGQTEQDIIRFCYENMEQAVHGPPQYRVDNAIEICDQKKLEEMTRALVRVTEKIENFLRRVGNECEESGLGKDFAVAIAARILVERAERGENEQTTGKETI